MNRVLRNFCRRSLATLSSSIWSSVFRGDFRQGVCRGGASGGKKQDVKQPISFLEDLRPGRFLYFQEGLYTIDLGTVGTTKVPLFPGVSITNRRK